MHYNHINPKKDTCPNCETVVDKMTLFNERTAPMDPHTKYNFPDNMPDIGKGVCQYCHMYIERDFPLTVLIPCGHLFHEECFEASRSIRNYLYPKNCVVCKQNIEYALICPYPYSVYNSA